MSQLEKQYSLVLLYIYIYICIYIYIYIYTHTHTHSIYIDIYTHRIYMDNNEKAQHLVIHFSREAGIKISILIANMVIKTTKT